MNFIERLLKGAIEKNISAKPILGNYSIDIEYVYDGIRYTIMKKDMSIVTIAKVISYNTVCLSFTPLAEDSDMDRVYTAVRNCFKDCEIKTF